MLLFWKCSEGMRGFMCGYILYSGSCGLRRCIVGLRHTDVYYDGMSLRDDLKSNLFLHHLSCATYRYVAPLLQKAIKVNALSAISCFTDVSVLFLGMSDVDLGALHPTGGDLWGQLIMATTQEVVFDHEGAVRAN